MLGLGLPGFDSKLVRLKENMRYAYYCARIGFDSKLVRLKGRPFSPPIFSTLVSIPNWFD